MGIEDQQSKPERIPLPSSDKNRKTRTDDIVCAAGRQKSGVIPSQCSHWRGNPPVIQTFLFQKSTLYLCLGDCHTSDIGHWFAMTGILTRSHAQTISSVRVVFLQKAAANPCRSLFDVMRWWITCATPARWHPSATPFQSPNLQRWPGSSVHLS